MARAASAVTARDPAQGPAGTAQACCCTSQGCVSTTIRPTDLVAALAQSPGQMKMGKDAPSQSGTEKPQVVSTSEAASQRVPRSNSCWGPVSLHAVLRSGAVHKPNQTPSLTWRPRASPGRTPAGGQSPCTPCCAPVRHCPKMASKAASQRWHGSDSRWGQVFLHTLLRQLVLGCMQTGAGRMSVTASGCPGRSPGHLQ